LEHGATGIRLKQNGTQPGPRLADHFSISNPWLLIRDLLTVSLHHCAPFYVERDATMPSFTLGTASQATGCAKSTILRAIKAGRISATRDDLGQWQIEPAELFRVFPPLAIPGMPSGQQQIEQGATPIERDATTDMLVAELRATLSDMRQDRDRWHEAYEKEQAAHARTQEALATTQRLLPPPAATPAERNATPDEEGIERGATRGARLRAFLFESDPVWRWWRRSA
jgi:hypothetical protein